MIGFCKVHNAYHKGNRCPACAPDGSGCKRFTAFFFENADFDVLASGYKEAKKVADEAAVQDHEDLGDLLDLWRVLEEPNHYLVETERNQCLEPSKDCRPGCVATVAGLPG